MASVSVSSLNRAVTTVVRHRGRAPGGGSKTGWSAPSVSVTAPAPSASRASWKASAWSGSVAMWS